MINKIKENGINRIVFLVFLIIWFGFGMVLKQININMQNKNVDTETLFILIFLGILHTIILALFVYLRHKNANVKYKLAVIISFVPIFNIAPIISGLYYKPKNSKGVISFIKEKYFQIANTGVLSSTGIFVSVVIIGMGYIYNIVWLIDNWGYLETFSKFINVGLMIFIPPFGGILGIYHFF